MFRFRHFSVRLLVMLLGLLFTVMAATYTLVSQANKKNALSSSEENLEAGVRYYENAIRQRIDYLASSAGVMSGDYAIRQVLLKDTPDRETLGSSLLSYTGRVGAPVIALFDIDEGNQLLATSEGSMSSENCGPFMHLIRQATADDMPRASGFSYLDHELHVLVVVPLYAPFPNIAAWFGLAFPIDRLFAQNIKDTTRLEVTFVSTEKGQPRFLATTLPEADALMVAQAATHPGQAPARIRRLDLPHERYVSLFQIQEMLGEDPVTVVLQRPLSAELKAANALEQSLVLISLGALAAAVLAGLWIARDVSGPVLALAQHTRLIARGDYEARLDLDRADELGQLADSFNAMSAGLAERDRVRDLLDKNVSPEVAAQLMRDGAALGGQEREVTILFADLRGFTTLSEKLAPPELLALLNRYLDRMSAEIERQGGVIDKFIGDEIMALFGAPVAQSDASDRALAAALGMERALVALNAELAAENTPLARLLPDGLGFGIGINTARVVAGNIGSHRRLNYSVIGDGVNVAARLQSLTRTADYRASIIMSSSTREALRGKFSARPLGTVTVKGRGRPVEIFAVDPEPAL